MREIRLNGVQYEITGDIVKRPVSPWKAKVVSGSLEYSDFSQAELEEWHDLRNGIGLESALPSESARLWWTEGIDFSTPRSAVLNPLVTTAGTFGHTPVKIIDFQSKTYAIGSDGYILVWNTSTSEWEDETYATTIENCEDVWNAFQNSNITHAVDSVDYKSGSNSLKLTVDSATVGEMMAIETISSQDMTGYSKVRAWVKSALATSAGDLQFHLNSGLTWTNPTGFVDSGSDWVNETNAYDDNPTSYASSVNIGATSWTDYLELTHSAISCDRVRFTVHNSTHDDVNQIDLDVYYGSAWNSIYTGSFTEDLETTKYFPMGTQTITAVRLRFYNSGGGGTEDVYFEEMDFGVITTETIDLPALEVDTWTKIIEDISTPSNLGTVTEIGIKSITDLGTEPYIIRIDDVRGVAPLGALMGTVLDALVITDKNDEWLIISSVAAAQYWDGDDDSDWSVLIDWHEGHTVNDPDSYWSNDANLIDSDTTSSISKVNIGNGNWTSYFEVLEGPSQRIDRIRYFVHSDTGADVDQIDIDAYYDGSWTSVYTGSFTENEWVVKELANALAHDVYKIRVRFHADGSATDDVYISGLQFGAGPSEYMAAYANRLYWVGADGDSINYSGVNDITAPGGHWHITGDVGIVYGLFEGKLLADGTPALYFHGNKGLYSVDTTNELIYKQEIEYPPLTYAGHAGMYWNANLWVATGYGILKISSSLASLIGPDQDDGLPSTYQGNVFDMVTVNNWLVYCVNGGVKTSLFQSYITGNDTRRTFYGAIWECQSFTPTVAHTITKVKLRLSRTGSPGTITVSIRATDGEGKPMVSDLASGTTDGDTLTTDGTGEWREITLGSGSSLVPNTKYIIVARATSGDTDNKAWWAMDNTDGTYSGGSRVRSIDSGSAWTVWTNDDMMFEEWGSSDKSSILKRNASYGGNLQVYTSSTAGAAIPCMLHSPSSMYANGRLWFGEGTSIKYMMFPDTTSNVKQISSFQYADDSGGSPYSMYPIFRKLASITKVALGVMAITKSCDGNEYIEVYYGLNGAATTTLLGKFKTSPRPTALTFNGGLGTEFQTIQFAIRLIRGSTNTNSPELESLTFYWYGTPTRISAWVINIEAIGDDAGQIFTDFETIFDTNTLVPFYPSGDPNKSSYNVKLTTMPSREWWEEQGMREGRFQIIVEEIFNG